MKRVLSLFAITMSLSILSLPAAAKRYHTDESDSDAEQPAPPRRARVDVSDAASSSTAAASSSDAAASAHADDHHTALSYPTFTSFLSYDDLRSLAATSKACKIAAKDRIEVIANSLQLPAGTSTACQIALAKIILQHKVQPSTDTTDKLVYPVSIPLAVKCRTVTHDPALATELTGLINNLIASIQQPYINACQQATTALTGKSLTEARVLFAALPDNEELTKMAYRYSWWQQHRDGDNLDEAVNLRAVFNDFNAAESYKLNFISLRDLPHDSILAQLIINLVLCAPEQTILNLKNLPRQSSIAITSSSLRHLYASDNPGLSALDLSNNPALTELDASGTVLTALDLRNNPALTYLHASNNPALTALDLSNNPALTILYAKKNPGLTALDLRNNPALTYLHASNNPALTALDLSNNPALTILNAFNNPGLTTLDLSNNPALTEFNAFNNPNLTEFRIGATRVDTAAIDEINAMVALNRARLR